jgi:RimJ/RimL family protein N-acetyltransferase
VWSNVSQRLAGRLVVIEPLAEVHEAELFEASQPPEIWQWWPFNPAADRETFHRWLHEVLEEVAAGREARFVVLDAAGRPIGSTSYCELRPEDRNVEIGWTWLTPSVWGTGVNAETKLLLLRHAFEQLGCHRVEFYTDELNERSRAALAALPAQFEGVLRDIRVLPNGRRRSSAVYSILDREWEDVQRQLTRRLAAHHDGAEASNS